MLDTILGNSGAIKRAQSLAARMLHRGGISADGATIAGAILGVLAGVAFAVDAVAAGILLLGISAAFDALDGTLAREFGAPTPGGGLLDLCADRLVEAAVIVGIVWSHPGLDFYALMLVASWYLNITVFLAVGAALKNAGPKLIEYPPGILERTEALIFFAVLAMVETSRHLSWMGPILVLAMTALEIATGVQRFLFGRRMLASGGG